MDNLQQWQLDRQRLAMILEKTLRPDYVDLGRAENLLNAGVIDLDKLREVKI